MRQSDLAKTQDGQTEHSEMVKLKNAPLKYLGHMSVCWAFRCAPGQKGRDLRMAAASYPNGFKYLGHMRRANDGRAYEIGSRVDEGEFDAGVHGARHNSAQLELYSGWKVSQYRTEGRGEFGTANVDVLEPSKLAPRDVRSAGDDAAVARRRVVSRGKQLARKLSNKYCFVSSGFGRRAEENMPSRCSECGSPFPNPPTEGSDPTIDVPVAPGTLARHQELLCTNAAPEGPELPYIQAIVSKTGARLADVEAEISRLRLLLQQLEDERASLSRYHTPNKAILSPLRRMPPEVLSEFFSWTLPRSSRHILALQKFDLINSPWVLTHVSRHWKAVAISTSSLWSLVVINWFRNKADPLSLVKVHIERAQTLEIHFYGGLKGIPPRQIEIFRALAEHSPKWVEFHAQLNSDILPLLASIRHRVPALRRLWMQWAEPAASQAGVLSIDCFQMAPSLLDVTVLNPSLSVHLPAHQLTRYNSLASWEVHCQILKLGKSLVQARIVLSDGETSGSDEMVESSMLRRLSISHPSILRHLTAPAVQDITFYLRTHEGPEALLSHLDPFVVRSDCTLRRLCLQGTPAAHTPTGILRKYPSISELVIITDHVQNDWNAT
ncbi:hypothetical protein DFH09DRAFT_1480114, partial [Mycena vulgaris]